MVEMINDAVCAIIASSLIAFIVQLVVDIKKKDFYKNLLHQNILINGEIFIFR